MPYHYHFNPDEFISNALKEDVGEGDHTSLACVPANLMGEAKLLVKEKGILAGVDLALRIFEKVDPGLTVKVYFQDGAKVKKGDIAFIVKGKSISILKAERLVLNCMQRMSGIATNTFLMTRELKGLKTKLLDTRKTTPGFRALEKKAVLLGDGRNHRFGLFDMILIKDNHVDFAGGMTEALRAAKQYLRKKKLDLKIEVEARNLKEVKEIMVHGGVDRILLDNFSIPDLVKAVKFINGKVETEASGNISMKTIRKYAECGVDYISVGALTHSYNSLDLSLKAVHTKQDE